MNYRVVKFGGSSVANINTLNAIKQIIKNKKIKVIVVSAFGKQNSNDIKLTDLLLNCVKEEFNKKYFLYSFRLVENKIKKMTQMLDIKFNYKKELNLIKRYYIKTKNKEYLISRGEYITAKMLSIYFNIPFVSSTKFMIIKNNKINYNIIQNKLNNILKKYNKIIVPGFYGISKNKIALFSRGGSDISGAIIVRALNYKYYDNYTDVDGILKINPNILNTKNNIKKLGLYDLKVMTRCDFNVIHKDVFNILKNTKIQLNIKSTINKGVGGTKVKNKELNNFYICYRQIKNNIFIYTKCKKIAKKRVFLNFLIKNNIKFKILDKNLFVLMTNKNNKLNLIYIVYFLLN